jgi:glycerophosphoryl diester phosphodiesterase/poly(3-hydroxybutyrate) depolymerase
MRKITLIGLCILAFTAVSFSRELEIVAHRGANHLAPENTFAAAQKCVQLGVDYVEVDVRTSQDGVMYVIHDKTLDRTTNGTGAVSERSSSYIDSLDAGSWFSSEFSDEKVPRLDAFLKRFNGRIKIYFDVKGADLGELLKLIYEIGYQDDCFFWFSNDDKARELRNLDPNIPLKMNAVDVAGLERVLDFNPQLIEYRLEHLTPAFVTFCRENNLKLMAHALQEGAESHYQSILDSAADMVNLDRADEMIALLNQANGEDPIRLTLNFNGKKREYFVRLPLDFDSQKTYWPLVSVHGGNGNGRTHFLAKATRQEANRQGLEAIVISPSFSNEDFQASRFPDLGEGAFLEAVLDDVRSKYQLHEEILITGYSRGGQFSHRFALRYPDGVAAAAPCASGTWTTPDGRLLIEAVGEISDAKSYLTGTADLSQVPERLHAMFNQRVANAAGLKASKDSKAIPFLVMCGSLDTRWDIARTFAESLRSQGYDVETSWPRTPHGGRSKQEFQWEFEKYSREVVRFFKRVTTKKETAE